MTDIQRLVSRKSVHSLRNVADVREIRERHWAYFEEDINISPSRSLLAA